MSTTKSIKETVQESYTRAVESMRDESTGGGCCSSANTKGVLIKHAGYSEEELAHLPPDAVENAFGCGNPLAFAGVKKGQTVLDIGSGAGIDCLIAAQQVGPEGKVIGLDMTPAMIDKARRNAEAAGLNNVEFRLGDAENMPVADSSVDLIVSNCVINLSPDKPAVFREAFRVLRPGGRISISDVVAEAIPEEIRANPRLYASCVGGAISERAYLETIRSAGFGEVEVVSRLVYTVDQLRGFLESEITGGRAGEEEKEVFERYRGMLGGQIASVKVQARKPL